MLKILLSDNDANHVASKLIDLYVSERARFVIMRKGSIYMPKTKGRYMRLSDYNIVQHIMQEYTVSVLGNEKGSRFLCFDVDADDLETVIELQRALQGLGIQRADIHISFSGRKGYHAELFFNDIVAHEHLECFYHATINRMKGDTRKIEYRPTASTSIKLPLSRHHTTGKMCWFLDPDSLYEIESYKYLFGIHPMEAKQFVALVNGLEYVPAAPNCSFEKIQRAGDYNKTITFTSYYPLPHLLTPGTRHETTVKIVVGLRDFGVCKEACEEILFAWLAQQNPALISSSFREALGDTLSICRWAYKKYVAGKSSSPVCVGISGYDMQRVMTRKGKTERKLYFLMLFNRNYWKPLHQEEMAAILGVSQSIVRRIIKRLVASKDLIIEYGGVQKTQAGHYCKRRNRYDIQRQDLSLQQRECWKTHHLYHSFPLPLTPEAFANAYHQTIHVMFGDMSLANMLTAQEYSEYRKHIDGSSETHLEKEWHHSTT